jgi:uncharacterized ion transporter superfamily protein YfcC|tara:strand:- start:1048 stop:1164 length:117 start_codon:yes stop_codon:yes gene_type:complete
MIADQIAFAVVIIALLVWFVPQGTYEDGGSAQQYKINF